MAAKQAESDRAVVVLGAGASFGARTSLPVPQRTSPRPAPPGLPPAATGDGAVGSQDAPPLGAELLQYVVRYLQHIRHLARQTGRADFLPLSIEEVDIVLLVAGGAIQRGQTFDGLVDQLLSQDRSSRSSLRLLYHALVAAFAPPPYDREMVLDAAFEIRPDRYDDLAHLLGDQLSKVDFITTNYDVLLEQALFRALDDGVSRLSDCVDYPHISTPEAASFRIFKVHGSINWWGTLRAGPITEHLQLRTDGVAYPKIEVIEDPYKHLTKQTGDEPILAHFASGRLVEVNVESIGLVRGAALQAIARAPRALVIGIRPVARREEDETVWDIFDQLGPGGTYIGMKQECEIVRPLGLDVREQSFEDFLNAGGLAKWSNG